MKIVIGGAGDWIPGIGGVAYLNSFSNPDLYMALTSRLLSRIIWAVASPSMLQNVSRMRQVTPLV